MKTQTFDALVAGFYQAATGAITWDTALDGVQAEFKARAAVLHTLDINTGRLLGLHCGGSDLSDAMLTYIRGYHEIDPRRLHALRRGPAGLGLWSHDHEVFDPAFVAKDRFYQDYLPAYATRYNSNVVIGVGDSVATAFILELPAARGVLSADERELVRRLGLHMQEALLAHERVRRLAAQALAGHGLLQSFPYPMWLIDAERWVYFSNPAALHEQATSEARMAQRGARFILTGDRADRALTQHLRALHEAGHGASAVIDLRGTASDPPTWLHLSLLVPGAALGVFGDRPQVLATLFDSSQVAALDPFALAQMFKLTPTEARVAVRLAEGLSAEEVAQVHGTRVTTVRTQIRQVLAKLGARRLTEVVRLLHQGEALWAQAGGARRPGAQAQA